MKKILLWDPRFPNAVPLRLEVDEAIASACVRAGTAAAADPLDARSLAAGGAVSSADPVEINIESGALKKLRRVTVPLEVALQAVSLGIASFADPLGTSRGGGGDPTRYMFWASGARQPSGSLVTAAAGTNYVMTKLVFGSPQYAINHLRLHFSGFGVTTSGSSPQETVLPGNATTIDGVWVEAGGVLSRLKFGGADGTAIASGANGAWTDDLALATPIAAETLVTIYTLYHTAEGEKQIPVYQIEKHRGERVWGAADAATLIALIGTSTASTAALDTAYGGTAQPELYGPDMMVAKGWDGRPVTLGVNDSIGERQNDSPQSADALRNKGWLRRWLDAPGGRGRIPHFLMGVPGAASRRELAANATKRWDVLDALIALNNGKWPFTCVIDQMSINDHQANYPTMKADWLDLITRLRARYANVPVIAIGTTPRTSASTDNYLTVASQTYNANGGVWQTGNYYLLDADKASLMGGVIQGFVDLIGPAYSATQGKWPAAWTTTLAAQAGTDGAAGYSTIRVVDEPARGEILRWGANGAQLAAVVDYSGEPGDWLVTLDRSTNVAVSAAGSAVFSPATTDGVHPRIREIERMAAAVPQAGKAVLI